MKNTLYIIFFLFSILEGKGLVYSQTIDSLKEALKKAKDDTTRRNISLKLAEMPGNNDWFFYTEQLVKFTENDLLKAANTTDKNFYKKCYAEALNNAGIICDDHGKIKQALEYYNKSLIIKEELNDKRGICDLLNNIGFVYQNQGDNFKALDFYLKSLLFEEEILNNNKTPSEIIKLKIGIATSMNNLGVVYMNLGDIQKALNYYHRSLQIQESINDKYGMAYSYNNIGVLYSHQEDNEKALEYYLKSLKIREDINDKKGIAGSLNDLGFLYNQLGNPQKAEEYYNKCMAIYIKIMDKKGVARSLNNLGSMATKKGDLNKGLDYYSKSLKNYNEINSKQGITLTLNNIGAVLLKQGKSNEALDYANRSLKIAEELGYPENIKNAAITLKNIRKKQNKFKEAFEMYEIELQMRDSLNNTETKKATIKKQFQYQYEKKASADSVKNAEEQKVKNAQLKAQQAQLKQEKTQRLALYGGLILVVIFSGFVFNRFKITQKQKRIIENQKQEVDQAYEKLHEKNKEVMDSIHYAARIQRSLITTEKYIAKCLYQLNQK